jgi:hypothetical protein
MKIYALQLLKINAEVGLTHLNDVDLHYYSTHTHIHIHTHTHTPAHNQRQSTWTYFKYERTVELQTTATRCRKNIGEHSRTALTPPDCCPLDLGNIKLAMKRI